MGRGVHIRRLPRPARAGTTAETWLLSFVCAQKHDSSAWDAVTPCAHPLCLTFIRSRTISTEVSKHAHITDAEVANVTIIDERRVSPDVLECLFAPPEYLVQVGENNRLGPRVRNKLVTAKAEPVARKAETGRPVAPVV